jgi:hypothetical protein
MQGHLFAGLEGAPLKEKRGKGFADLTKFISGHRDRTSNIDIESNRYVPQTERIPNPLRSRRRSMAFSGFRVRPRFRCSDSAPAITSAMSS